MKAHEGQPAAIQDGNFQVVDLHVGVVDAHGIERAQQVLGGGDQDALPHQAGGIADARHVAPTGGDREVVQVGAQENDAGARQGRAGCGCCTGTPLCRPTPEASRGG